MQDELLPQATAVLPGKLAGEIVQVPHALDGDQERLVVGEPGGVQLGDLVAQMTLELVDVVPVESIPVVQVCPPFSDLGFDPWARHVDPKAVVSSPDPGQMLPRVLATANHCACCSARAARPSSVIE